MSTFCIFKLSLANSLKMAEGFSLPPNHIASDVVRSIHGAFGRYVRSGMPLFFFWGAGGREVGQFLFISTFKTGDSQVLGQKFAGRPGFRNVARRGRGRGLKMTPCFFDLENMIFLEVFVFEPWSCEALFSRPGEAPPRMSAGAVYVDFSCVLSKRRCWRPW